MSNGPLSVGAYGDDVAHLHETLRQRGIELPASEVDRAFFGAATRQAVQQFQQQNALPVTGDVDAHTAQALDTPIAVLPSGGDGRMIAESSMGGGVAGQAPPQPEVAIRDDSVAGVTLPASGPSAPVSTATSTVTRGRLVTGTVTNPDGLPLAGATVIALDCDLRTAKEIGRAKTDRNGTYRIGYAAEDLLPDSPAADLRVEVRDERGEALCTSPITFNAPTPARIDVALGGTRHDRPSELSSLVKTVSPLLGKLDATELVENDQHQDLSFLTGETGIPKVRLAFWTLAARIAHKTELPLELFYALLRGGIPADGQTMALASAANGVDLDGNGDRLLVAIESASGTARSGAVEIAIQSNIVRASYKDRAQRDLEQLAGMAGRAVLSSNNGFGKASLGAVFDKLKVGGSTQENFVQLYAAAGGSTQRGFWTDLAKNPAFTKADVSALRFGVAVGRLTRGHLPLIGELATQREAGKLKGARDLARLTAEDWKQLLQQQVDGQPIGVPPSFHAPTPEQRSDRYSAMLERNFTATYPTPAFSARVAKDPKQPFPDSAAVAELLDANPALDLTRSNLDAFAKTTPMAENVKTSLLAAQRLIKVNPSYTVMSALMADGIHSAYQVYAMGRDHFVAHYGSLPALGPTEAARMYAQAEQTHAVALAVSLRLNSQLAASTPAAVRDAPSSDAAERLAGYPTLQTLFGADSWCSCSDCESVLGAPAYLADMLEFLNRRSPIPGKSVIAAGKSVRDVLLERRPDIDQILLSCPNTNTALPYIDLVNELLEDAVAPPPSPPPPSRRRQTTLTTPELNANPEYVNGDAYQKLASAVFPWTLPFDLPLAEARTYLGQLGLDRADLIRGFQKPDGHPQTSPQADAIAVETLGMTAVEADIITAGALAAGRQPWDWWGLSQSGSIVDPSDPTKTLTGSWTDLLAQVRVLLNRAGLTYQELARLLNTLFINNDGKITINCDPPDSCNVATMTIGWGTADAATIGNILERIHRFVRLWRPLGWGVYDVDDAIAILQNATPQGLTRLNDQLLRQLAVITTLTKRHALAVREALALFVTTPTFASIPTRDIPTLPGDDARNSLYRDLFENLTVLNPADTIFALNDAGTEIKAIASAPLLADHRPALVAGLQVAEIDLSLAIDRLPDGKLTLANLSDIHRTVKLSSILGITVEELTKLLAIVEAPIDAVPGYEQVSPFDGTRPEAILTFAAVFDAIRASGLSIEQVDYIVRDVYDAASGVAPDPVAVGTMLLALRNGLLKIAAETKPVPDPTGVNARKQLAKALTQTDVDVMIGILDGSNKPATPNPALFVSTALGPYMDGAAAQAKLAGAGALPAGQKRFEYVLDGLLAYERRTRSTGLVVQSLAQALGLRTATAALLLNDWFPSASTPGAHAIVDFLALPDVALSDTTDPIPPDAPGFGSYFTTYAALAKAALIIASLNLTSEDVDWWHGSGIKLGWLDPTTLPTSAAATAQGRFYGLSRILAARNVRDRIAIPSGSFKKLFGLAGGSTTKDSYLRQLEALTQWPADTLNTLCGDPAATPANNGLLSLTYPDDYRSEVALGRLAPAIHTIMLTGIRADIGGWLAATVTTDVADAIKQAVKSRYPISQWLSIAKQLRDPLRQRQRDALVAYLLAVAPPAEVTRWLDPGDVFGHFLIDVEMGSCMETSRIVQATATVQLFVQRCILGVEPSVSVDVNLDGDWTQWEWMSQYRVWQANREVFLFPENWIDPSLRANKSQFFANLEKELKQSDVTSEVVEAALANYLEKLEAVARLDVCGTFHDSELDHGQSHDVLHVIARTQGHPPVYYHRKWVDSSFWIPWEKVDLEIASNHALPVVWNGKHYLFWAVCNVKQDKSNNPQQTIPKGGDKVTPPPPRVHLEVQLAWSQYKQGKWQPKQTAPQTLVFQGDWESADVTLKSSPNGDLLQIDAFLDEVDVSIHVGTTTDPFGIPLPVVTESVDVRNNPRVHVGAYLLGGVATGVEAFLSSDYFSGLGQVGGANVAEVGQLDRTVLKPKIVTPSGTNFDGDWLAPSRTWFASAARPRLAAMYASFTFYSSLASEWVLGSADYFRLIVPHQTPAFDSSLPFFYRDASREYFIVPTIYYQSGNYFTTTAPAYVYHPFYRMEYQFYPFYHPFVRLLVRQLNWGGVDALYKRELQLDPAKFAGTAPFDFDSYYQPTEIVLPPHPAEAFDFDPDAGYALYNWELFYHAPFLVGNVLAAHQRFDLARHWYEYIFNPAGSASGLSGATLDKPQRYWITKPLFLGQAQDFFDQQLAELMQRINQRDSTLDHQVAMWRKDPFDPDAIAQWRNVAYARALVMKYIDNLISWGDQQFTRDTRESVNLATQLYVLAAELLGPRPEIVQPRVQPTPKTYDDLKGSFDDFSNAAVAAENVIPPVRVNVPTTDGTPKLPSLPTLYFRIPPNTQLLTYWDKVADRLFKIRHCMNIEGVVQQLPLFAPPISPGLLIAAAAAGLDLSSVLSDSDAAIPPYRFRTMIRQAIELCEVVRGLGAELLAALEKSDAEALARIRSGAEKQVQAAIADVRAREIDAANQAIDVLAKSKQTFIDRANFYVGRSLMNEWETTSLIAQGTAVAAEVAAGIVELAAAAGHILPAGTVGAQGIASPTAVVKFGGDNIGRSAHSAAAVLRIAAAVAQTGAQMSIALGGHHQRKDSWDLEGRVAQDEMARIDSETLAAQIRLDIAQKQKDTQDLTVQEANEVDDFLHNKFTDQELYDWMVGETSTTFFQAYQLAYATAKQAERCFQRELAISDSSYVQFGYWDSLRKGLTSGDKLLYDLRRLESAYYSQNVRELEITKHASLLQIDPYALVELRDTGTCTVELPEILFDLDNPGHYMRRLKNVAVTIPCIVGPYGGVAMTLTLLSSQLRTAADASPASLVAGSGGTSQIVTSSAQNDAGFDPSPDDDRYQPFYGSGAISTWQLTLNNVVPQFDYSTITDVVLHLRYTARDGGEGFRDTVKGTVRSQLNTMALAQSRKGLYRLISARHEYATEWAKFLHPPAGSDQVLSLATLPERFPFFTNGMDIKARGLDIIVKTADPGDLTLVLTPPGAAPHTVTCAADPTLGGAHHVNVPISPAVGLGTAPTPSGQAPPTWVFKLKKAGAADFTSLTQADLDDLVVIVSYEVS
jgi:peptidoglycan hydrolase-like protein with peptidoglycan-binding domain